MNAFAGQRTVAIVNPAAGRGAGSSVARRIAGEFRDAGATLEVRRTSGPDEAGRLARDAVIDGCRVVVAVGGDGTANEIANGIIGTGAALALYPIGSGNDFARALGYPLRGKGVASFLTRATRRTIDVGEANGRVFLNSAGIGIDGYAAERVEATARVVGPTLGYFVGALVAIATYRALDMRVQVDGQARLGKYLIALASNGTHFGGGMKAAPGAKLDDGWLDVLLASDLGKASQLVALGRLYRGTHVNGKTIVLRRARAVEVELERKIAVQIDGEVTHARGLSVRIRPRALDVLAA